jgi:LDH2 family malate/lactate/ureidoglycolate dehydrogenase
MAIDTEAFMGADIFKKITGDILRELRSSKLSPNEKQIFTAGEKEYLSYLERKDKGVPVGESVKEDLIAVRNMLNLQHIFPFENK